MTVTRVHGRNSGAALSRCRFQCASGSRGRIWRDRIALDLRPGQRAQVLGQERGRVGAQDGIILGHGRRLTGSSHLIPKPGQLPLEWQRSPTFPYMPGRRCHSARSRALCHRQHDSERRLRRRADLRSCRQTAHVLTEGMANGGAEVPGLLHTARAASAPPSWLSHHLTVTDPKATVAAFAASARA